MGLVSTTYDTYLEFIYHLRHPLISRRTSECKYLPLRVNDFFGDWHQASGSKNDKGCSITHGSGRSTIRRASHICDCPVIRTQMMS
jgi:hypothetical protein